MTINRLITNRNVTSDFCGFIDDFGGEYECRWFEGTLAKEGNYMQDALKLIE